MYAPSYPSFNNQGGGGNGQPGFNPSGAPHTPQLQHHQPQQQQPNMMYNNGQQFVQGPHPPHQNPYGGGGPPNQNMNPNMMMQNGPMMQNGGMAHMAANNGIVPPYQTPYSGSPYGPGAGTPSSAGPHGQGPFMPPSSNPQQFAMPAQNMTPQPHQRMHPSAAGTPVPSNQQRASPFNGAVQSTPPQSQSQGQFMTPVNQNSNQQQQNSQTSMQNQQGGQNPQSAGVQTPQTPSFPNNVGPNTVMAPPLSPGSEIREKERVTTLLDINRELLMEVVRLQVEQAEAKAKDAADTEKSAEVDQQKQDKAAATTKEYVDCMRRLQYNLAYLAAIADRSHKPSSQIPPHPAIMSAPVLTILPKNKSGSAAKKDDPVKNEESDAKAGLSSTEQQAQDRVLSLQQLYKRLQSLFPDVKDYTKEPVMAPTAKGKPAQGQIAGGQSNQPNANQGVNSNSGNSQAQQHQTPKMPNQPQPQQNSQSSSQQHPSQGMNPNMSQMQQQQQAAMMARQQQLMAAAAGNNPNMGGGFNPQMMGGMGMNMNPNMMNMQGMNGMNMGPMNGMNPSMMGMGMNIQPNQSGGMMGPGQGMGMNPNMMGMGGMGMGQGQGQPGGGSR